MCKSRITLKKFLKLYLEIIFYRLVISIIFALFGKEKISTISVLRSLLPFTTITVGFTNAFLAYYIIIPYINILIENLDEKSHLKLLIFGFIIYVIFGTDINFLITFNYLEWFVYLHLFAAYLRLYPKKIYDGIKLWLLILSLSVFIMCASVIICFHQSLETGKNIIYRYATDSNSLLPFLIGMSSFMLFKNLRIPYSKLINTVASTCFGVLLIHAQSDTMRQWLWKDTLANIQQFTTSHVYIHAILSVLVVFIVCSCLDYLRISLIEKPLFSIFENKLNNIHI